MQEGRDLLVIEEILGADGTAFFLAWGNFTEWLLALFFPKFLLSFCRL